MPCESIRVPRESIRANLRNFGVRIACPLSGCTSMNVQTTNPHSQNNEWTRTKLNPFGQTKKRCSTAARATFQNYKSELPNYEQKFSDYDWRSRAWNFQTTNGPKSTYKTKSREGKQQPRNYESRGRTVLRNALSTAGTMTSSERPSPEPPLKKRCYFCDCSTAVYCVSEKKKLVTSKL